MPSRFVTCPCWLTAGTSHQRAAIAALSFLLSMTDEPDPTLLDELIDSVEEIRPWRQA